LPGAFRLPRLFRSILASRQQESPGAGRVERHLPSPPRPQPGDPSGERTARQARHAVSALLSHALPPCRARLLLLPDVTPREAAEALLTTSLEGPDAMEREPPGQGAPGSEVSGGGGGGGAFGLASDGALDLLDWLWPLTHSAGRRARRLAQQLHQRLCLEVEAAVTEAAAAAAAAPTAGSPGPGGGEAEAGWLGAPPGGPCVGARVTVGSVSVPTRFSRVTHGALTQNLRAFSWLRTPLLSGPVSPGPSSRWLRALHPGAAARAAALAPPLALHRPLPAAAAAELGLPACGPQEDGPAGVGELRAWLRALEAAADWVVWALDQRCGLGLRRGQGPMPMLLMVQTPLGAALLFCCECLNVSPRLGALPSHPPSPFGLLRMLTPKEAARLAASPPQSSPTPPPPGGVLGDALVALLAAALPRLAPGGGGPALDVAALSGAPALLRGSEQDLREASGAVAALLARLAAARGALAPLAAPAARLSVGGGPDDGGLINFCLLGLLAPAVLGFKPSDGEGEAGY
jgi:hypothetical protein